MKRKIKVLKPEKFKKIIGILIIFVFLMLFIFFLVFLNRVPEEPKQIVINQNGTSEGSLLSQDFFGFPFWLFFIPMFYWIWKMFSNRE